jgi:hypothetical protein
MNKQFTLLEWIVLFSLLIFLVIKSADAKTHTKKHHAIQTYGNISVMVTDITEDKIRPGAWIGKYD